ncbi:MAG: FAD-binding oxidoreductase [Gammaproteobacteria bacterium]
MTRLDDILWVRPGAARVQSGARLHAIDTEARRIGWEQRLLPSTFRLATAGGYVAGGCCGIGSIAHGALKDPGNFLGARVVSVEKTPRIRELRGETARDLHHSYGVNGIMTELELALAPAHDWHEFIVCFDDFMDAAHFARRVGEADGIAKRLVTVLAWPIPAYFTPLSAHLPTGRHAVILLIAESSVETFYELCSHAGGEVTYSKSAEELRAGGRTLIEYTWNHTTLYALKADKSMTYLQTGYRPERDLKTMERICRYFGDELMMHLEFIRADGAVTCSGLPLIRFSDEARLNEIIRYHEANGVFVANPHTYVIEDGGKKVIDPRQLRSKEELDPGGILNPGKLKAWDSHGPGAGEGAA